MKLNNNCVHVALLAIQCCSNYDDENIHFRDLYATVENVPTHKFAIFEPGQPKLFGSYLDKLMGFSSKQ